MLILFAPGAPREAYFEELAEIATSGRQLSKEEWTDSLPPPRPVHDLRNLNFPCRPARPLNWANRVNRRARQG